VLVDREPVAVALDVPRDLPLSYASGSIERVRSS